ncbi:pantoate--beta-alanine ligase [Ketobacter alkanivorans]|uniref:Pantothenate synthetase n=1 Tax=Ketobacter alkanivorans TaxID=1917421 RepID=A0A2K9LSP7_9GAMM|nr:pantoate--beta-alanine ligase [Ketobacter alkanivorans]AUM13854.1 pantoate--beta-alanine ligase [Ketobacter alkanivorans]MCP5017487.1 pantoate--beta-alanine ligase [Ketobacter sp.]
MKTVHTIQELRNEVHRQRMAGKRIGFVPTMGNLHAGHISLITEGLKQADIMVSSVFVNPTQFGPGEDFDSYPRTLEADAAKLEAAGCHLLFAPPVTEMYPGDQDKWAKVVVTEITDRHCGAARPGHFDGVSTVVSKLFNIVLPDVALFGKKDFQQLAVIRRMTTALCFGIEIIGVETVREANGLAMSSRNGYLTDDEKQRGATLYQCLQAAKEQICNGARDYDAISQQANAKLAAAGFEPEYFSVCRADTLEPATPDNKDLVILAVARMGKARLIDNIDFKL